MKPRVLIIDSGICNVFNIRGALAHLGAEITISCDRQQILAAPRVVLPGVGAFRAGMDSLERWGLIPTIRDFVRSGKAFLGICLGMQLLLSQSEEHGLWEGLSIIPGCVRKFRQAEGTTRPYKIPQIGWNTLTPHERPWTGTLLHDMPSDPSVYFVHSYVVEPEDPQVIVARTFYGQEHFCSVLMQENLAACQFHPERSGAVGLQILKNFLSLPS